ncbi:transcription initiation factor IIE subunit beta isoform X2 [Mustela erminea]|uniref:transcription initiation factor IIE subunit beta isoform X2 n=1 Tax=Mustela erminea TaxID=36723 RepID=UPI001386B44D|nr:transcription initiation factor IIE subunit beta isoform X2 [Mustela erminea]
MDPSLLRERELFKKRALSTPVVEKRSVSSESSSSSSKKKKAKLEHGGSSGSKQNSDHSNGSFNLKALSGSSGYKFGVLAKIVNYMKTRHQRGDTHPLTLEEILDETQHLDIGLKQKQWLMTEALVNNPKIEVIDGKYAFKPKYNLKDKKALLRLLDKHDQRGLGGILLEDIEEGLPNSQKAVKALGDQILFVNRPDKKKILFFNDKSCQFSVDEGFGLCVMLDTSKEKYSFPFSSHSYENIRFLEDLNTNAHEFLCLVVSWTVFFVSSLVMSIIKFPIS